MNNIISPNIRGNDREQLSQMRSYLYQLAEQLNFALSQVNIQAQTVKQQAKSKKAAQSAEDTFNSIKALIIKSADIVNAYEDKITQDLASVYVLQSDFGTYAEETNTRITATAGQVSAATNQIAAISGDVEILKETDAYFKVGLLDSDTYGIEIGRTTSQSGVTTFSRYARFLPNKLSFYDSAGNELAYFSDYRLFVSGITVEEIKAGGYKMLTNDGLMFIWEGI